LLQESVSAIDWSEEMDCKKEFRKSDFRRLDESSDDIFYEIPRFVEHIDPYAVAALTDFHGRILSTLNNNLHGEK
jgi:hypothetical protein